MYHDLKGVYDALMRYTSPEELLRNYYRKHKDYCPPEELWVYREQLLKDNLLLAGLTDSALPMSEIDGLRLSENRYIQSGEDIAVLKHQRYLFPLVHQHSFFELLYVLQGSCTNTIDDKTQRLYEGSMCIIPPSVSHSIAVNEDDSLVLNFLVRASTFNQSFTALLDSNDILSTFLSEIVYSNKYRKYLLFHTGDSCILKQTALAMFETYQHKGHYYNRIMNGYFMVLMGALLQAHEDTIEYPERYFEKYNIVPKLLNYIESHIDSATLETCAKRFHFNQRHLGRLLKKETGFTFPQLVTNIRVNIAKEMLLQHPISLDELAAKLGYNDSSYFIRVFKKEVGCTPSDYRKTSTE